MSRIERGVAALLLATAVAGGALIPRFLSQPAGPLGTAALAPRPYAGPSRIVVQAPAVPKPAIRPRLESPPAAQVTPVLLVPAVAPRPVAKPGAASGHHAPSPTSPTTASQPPPDTTQDMPTVATDLVNSPPAPRPTGTKPGNGYGDENHVHTGPPGHVLESPKSGADLRGSGHGRGIPQASTHAVGAHHRGVGHLAPPPPTAAQAAPAPGPQARPQGRGQGGHGGPPPPVAHGHGHG
jgi:hypothetical protein